MKLNKEQEEAVHYVKGPCLVLAGAGSGKTRVITNKIINLIKNNIDARQICAVTFTNKAASEMQERVALDVGKKVASSIFISTFHSLGLFILKREHERLNLTQNFSLFDEYDQQKAIKEIIRNNFANEANRFDGGENTLTQLVIEYISKCKNYLIPVEKVAKSQVVKDIINQYNQYVLSCNAVDFDDLIYLPTILFQQNEALAAKWSSRFKYILVDEYQDTNETQYQLLKILVSKYRSFTVVGDDDQSIYSWRGARPENINELSKDYPDLHIIKLEDNYRSSVEILSCANEVIKNNPHIFVKQLRSNIGFHDNVEVTSAYDEYQEAIFVASEIINIRHDYKVNYNQEISFDNFAILYRSNFQSKIIEKVLAQNKMPCTITGGQSFFEQTEIKDILSWCKLIINPFDNSSLLRIINIPKRGIGPDCISKLNKVAKAKNQSLYETCLDLDYLTLLNTSQIEGFREFILLLNGLRRILYEEKNSIKLATLLLKEIKYESYLSTIIANKIALDIKIKNVRLLQSWILEYVQGSKLNCAVNFSEAISRLSLREIMDKKDDKDIDSIHLMTLHAAKGLEFPIVFMIGCEENILPHKTSIQDDTKNNTSFNIEEERRLVYVGITRAKKKLYMTYCQNRKKKDNYEPVSQSRFITELPIKYTSFHNFTYRNKEAEKEQQNSLKNIYTVDDAFNSVHKLNSKNK